MKGSTHRWIICRRFSMKEELWWPLKDRGVRRWKRTRRKEIYIAVYNNIIMDKFKIAGLNLFQQRQTPCLCNTSNVFNKALHTLFHSTSIFKSHWTYLVSRFAVWQAGNGTQLQDSRDGKIKLKTQLHLLANLNMKLKLKACSTNQKNWGNLKQNWTKN